MTSPGKPKTKLQQQPPEQADDDQYVSAITEEYVYNGKLIDWCYWVQQKPMLTVGQAARLMCALDPDVFDSLAYRPNRNYPDGATKAAKKIQREAKAQGKKSATPKEWLEWADMNAIRVHVRFRTAVESHSPAAKGSRTAAPVGLTKAQILAWDWPTRIRLDSKLSDIPKWIKPARVSPGTKGKNGSARWNPVQIAVCLCSEKNVSQKAMDAHIRRRFPEWLDQWEEANSLLNTGT
ncbi:MAG: hypothetical protein ABI728_13425 [Betaproteobacteria bacterium]